VSKASYQRALEVLIDRCGEWSRVFLKSGRQCKVYDVAWNFESADQIAKITTNISPGPDEPHPVDTFKADEIVKIEDSRSGEVCFDAASP
jgi:hypothetical protein